jgi:hypothetical protein
MMVTVSELEAVIAQTPSGEQVQFDTKLIGSVDHVTRKLTELKLKRASLPLRGNFRYWHKNTMGNALAAPKFILEIMLDCV